MCSSYKNRTNSESHRSHSCRYKFRTVFLKKIIVREISGVTKWELTQDVKPLVQNAESWFDQHIKFNCGINPQLMMHVNYARTLIETPHSVSLEHLSDYDAW